jgi:hypothetical protein
MKSRNWFEIAITGAIIQDLTEGLNLPASSIGVVCSTDEQTHSMEK